MSEIRYSGGCLCGDVTYALSGNAEDINGVTACHCQQCRKWAGHHWASIHGPLSGFSITQGESSVKWYTSSDKARRGFCENCGSSLFWHGENYPSIADQIDVSAGSLDDPRDLKIFRHIFCKFKGDYYEIKDGVTVYDSFPGAP